MRISAVLFDVDGTLLDTEAYIFGAFDAALASAGLPPGTHLAYRAVVGLPLEECYRRLAPDHDPEALCEVHRQWQRQHLELVRAFPGARALLERLRARGIRTAAVTNRSVRSSLPSLERAELLSQLDTVVSVEDVRHQKPDPEPVLLALARVGVAPGEAVMVGDTTVDVQAARAAGVRALAVGFGFGAATIAASRPDAIVHHLADVLAWIDRGAASQDASGAEPAAPS